jgi:hypothetical protein
MRVRVTDGTRVWVRVWVRVRVRTRTMVRVKVKVVVLKSGCTSMKGDTRTPLRG